MPAGDGTGPMGMGPMTGRAAGFCAGRGFGFGRGRWSGFGRGLGLGFRGGRGWGGANWASPCAAAPYATPYGVGPTREQEADMLKGQAEYFEDALDGIKKRIAEIEAKTEDK